MRRNLYNSVDVPFLIKGRTVEPNQEVNLYIYDGHLYSNNFIRTVSNDDCVFEFNSDTFKRAEINADVSILSMHLGYLVPQLPNDAMNNIKEVCLADNLCKFLLTHHPIFRLKFLCTQCTNLEKFIAPNILFDYMYWDNPNQTLMGGMFYQCPSLKYIDLSNVKVPELDPNLDHNSIEYNIAICPFSLFTDVLKVHVASTDPNCGKYQAVLNDSNICKYDNLTIKCQRNLKAYNEVALEGSNVNWIFVD